MRSGNKAYCFLRGFLAAIIAVITIVCLSILALPVLIWEIWQKNEVV